MADYIYLLDNRLSPAQRAALRLVREVARAKGITVFLVGGAVRDLTSGSPVRDLDVVVQGNALKLKKDIEKAGGVLTGELDAAQSLYFVFPGNVRMEVGSTLSVTFPKPGRAVMKPATILDDLRRRDFTANAMALSLNEGSYGLLMDPLNGVADIENRELRLVSNYGFIEDPVRMVRAARLMARLGWVMDERSQARYETGQREGYISALSEFLRGYETEEIVHEEDPLRVLKRLEAEGWMKVLAPYWTAAKVNAAELERLRDVQAQLQVQGIQPDMAAASFPLLTAKLTPKEVATLKAGFARQGFVKEIESLEGEAKDFATQLGGKGAAAPSQAWRMLMAAKPEAVLWMAYSTKNAALQAKLKSFSTEWPQARQKMPYTLMQEMRITPEVAGYDDLLEKLFFELMDGRLTTPEEMKAFLEPYSPPAPPPPVNMRRPRAQKKDGKGSKSRTKKVALEDEDAAEENIEAAEETEGAAEDKPTDSPLEEPAVQAAVKSAPEKTAAVKTGASKGVPEKTVGIKAVAAKSGATKSAAATSSSTTSAPAKAAPAKAASAKAASGKSSATKTVPVKSAAAKGAAVKGAPVKVIAGKAAGKSVPAKKPAVTQKTASNAAQKHAPQKIAAKSAPQVAKGAPVKAAAKKVVAKTVTKAAKTTVKALAKKAAAKKVAAKAPIKVPVNTPVKASKAPAKAAVKKQAAKGGGRR